jgi:hypothetical protein
MEKKNKENEKYCNLVGVLKNELKLTHAIGQKK